MWIMRKTVFLYVFTFLNFREPVMKNWGVFSSKQPYLKNNTYNYWALEIR